MAAIAMHHEITGPDDAPALLLLNSLGSTLAMWDPQAPALAEHLRVIRCDTRGHGQSPVPPGPYAIDDLADDALALLDTIGVERAHVAGLSLGGMVAMRLAIRNPERVSRLALLCTSAQLGPADAWVERAAAVRAGGSGAVADTVVSRWLTDAHRAADPRTAAALRDMIAATPAEGYASCCDAIAVMDQRDGLSGIGAPTLVIAGTDDPATPPVHLHAIADAVPGATLLELADCAHLATLDQPGPVTSALVAHFTEVAHRG